MELREPGSWIIGCGNLVVDDEGSVLLVREAKPSARGRFNLPAGKPEPGETLAEAAVREAREETGLAVEIDHLVGLYQCPRTSEGFGVLNLVFASRVVGGVLTTSAAHPDVRFCTRAEVRDLGAARLLRGTHIERAIDDHAAGRRLPADLVRVCAASPFPDPSDRPDSGAPVDGGALQGPTAALLEAHHAQQLVTNHVPTLDVPEEVKALRLALVEEEAEELRIAVEANDIVEVADALGDLLTVVYGAALTFGIPIAEVFAEIHRSNMTKLDDDGQPILRADGKVLKGSHFSPPDLLPILERHGYRPA